MLQRSYFQSEARCSSKEVGPSDVLLPGNRKLFNVQNPGQMDFSLQFEIKTEQICCCFGLAVPAPSWDFKNRNMGCVSHPMDHLFICKELPFGSALSLLLKTLWTAYSEREYCMPVGHDCWHISSLSFFSLLF